VIGQTGKKATEQTAAAKMDWKTPYSQDTTTKKKKKQKKKKNERASVRRLTF